MKLNPLTLTFPYELPSRPVQVWKPDDWDSAVDRRILLMHDGQNMFHRKDSFAGIWGIVPALNRLRSMGAVSSTAVIGVWNGGERRFAEYMPEIRPIGDSLWDTLGSEYGGDVRPVSKIYSRWLVTEVLPAARNYLGDMASQLPVSTMGSSMGGLISLELITSYQDVFASAACLSTHWTAADDPTVDYFLPRIPEPGTHRLYFDRGSRGLDKEYGPYQDRVDREFISRGWRFGSDFLSLRFHGASHSEKSWRERIEVPLSFILSAQERVLPEG
jgi:predicted alpha/beta superfamily hydrolase